MKASDKIYNFIYEWAPLAGMILVGILIVSLLVCLVIEIVEPDVPQGMVMNKWFSEGYTICSEDGKCTTEKDRWIIAVQNGDKKDFWQVTESYYDAIKIGSWVEK